MDGRTDDGQTPDHGHPISSPCEPNGSGELITSVAWGNLINYRAHKTNSCITVWSIKFLGMYTLPHEISSSLRKV